MDRTSDSARVGVAERLFAGGGENGKVLAGIDWAATPLGPVESWPQSLRTALRICLTSQHPLFVWWGPDFIKMYNDAYSPVPGKRHPWALGKPGREVWPEIWDIIGPMLEHVRTTGEATWSDDQLLLLERNGYPEECYFTFSYSPIEDETGGVGGVFTAVTETTQRVLNERRGRLARDLAAALVEVRTVDDVIRHAARVLASDPADIPCALLYAVDAPTQTATLRQAIGLASGTALSPRTLSLHAQQPWPLAEALATNQPQIVTPIFWGDIPFLEDANLKPHTALVVPVTEPGQNAPTLLWVVGISPRRALDAEYRTFYALLTGHLATAMAAAHAYEAERRRVEELAALDRAKTTFFSNVSHEFRTPLTLMLGPIADSLVDEDDPLSPAQRARQELVQRNGLRLLKLVNTLLDFSRIEAGRVQASFVPTDLAAFTADLASSFRSLIEKSGLSFEVVCPPLPEPVYIDRDMWEKIVLNLLSNAFKFTFEGGINVRLSAEEGQVALTVSDTGTGIPPEELPRLFERFHRVEGARSRTHEGSGIGLALVQELVHLHGGEITAQSHMPGGTTFTVRLPLGAQHLAHERVSAAPTLYSTAVGADVFVEEAEHWLGQPEHAAAQSGIGQVGLNRLLAAPTRGARIVLADDNADMREYLLRLLGEHYQVTAVANGAEALTAIQADPPDLVLSDVMMPELDGFELLDRLRGDARTAPLPVILLSARAGEEATIEGLARGADDYLIKPFSAREVLSRVAARLEIARTRQEAQAQTRASLDALLHMARLLLEDAPLAAASLTQQMVEAAQRILNVPFVTLSSVDPTTKSVTIQALAGFSPAQSEKLRHQVATFKLHETMLPADYARLIAGESVVMDLLHPPYASQDPGYDSSQAVLIPLRSRGQLLGIFSLSVLPPKLSVSAEEVALTEGVARLMQLVLERERLSQERIAAESRVLALDAANQRMDEFLGIAGHELRTPLTSIKLNVGLSHQTVLGVQDATPPEVLQRKLARLALMLERTGIQVERMDRLVDDLLDVSRITAGKLDMRMEPCDLLAIVRERVAEQRAAWADRHISVEASRLTSLPIIGDADRIGQVITNFVTNALKYAPAEQPIVVSVRRQNGHARVAVRDHGPGLTPDQQVHLFERFYRVPGIHQLNKSGMGLGLGLYICHTIITRHDGEIGVESARGKGSTFWFTLPVSK